MISIIIIIAISILVIWFFINSDKNYKPTKYVEEKDEAQSYNGDIKKGIAFIKKIKESRANYETNYDVSQVYRYNIQDNNAKETEYINTLELIADGILTDTYDNEEVSYILNKIIFVWIMAV